MTAVQLDLADRELIARTSLGWLGTPYRHQASIKGVGADHHGLIRGVWRDLLGPEPDPLPPYTPDWAETGGGEPLLDWYRANLIEVATGNSNVGDVLVFRMGLGSQAKHSAIVVGDKRIVHAYWGRSVCETRLVPWWQRRICAAFSFPTLEQRK